MLVSFVKIFVVEMFGVEFEVEMVFNDFILVLDV